MTATAGGTYRGLILLGSMVAAVCSSGCSQYIDPNVPEPIRPFAEPEFGREYLLYRPSSYDRAASWPLVVVCAGAFPDSPNQRIRAWTQPAEQYGFLVAAPALEGNRASWLSDAARHVAEQREDEERILSTVRHIRAGHHVSEDRIFIHGWSGGAPVALRVGLRHPDVFRAIAVSQPRFDEACVAEAEAARDIHQPVFVHYNVSDVMTGKQGQLCAEWLQSRFVHATASPHGAVRPDEMEPAVEFFEDVVRSVPWVRLRAVPTADGDPLVFQFKLRSSFQPARYRWDFGDGESSPEAEPVHAYAEPGDYVVTVEVAGPGGHVYTRTARLSVPEGLLRNVAKPSTAEPSAAGTP